MLTTDEYTTLHAQYDAYEAARKQLFPGKNYVDRDMAAQLPESPTNEQRSAIEVYEWVNDPPDRYFAYVNEKTRKLTTWTGDVLGHVHFGRTYQSNMGDKRCHIWVTAINGREYTGTYYASAGDYACIRALKGSAS